MVPPIKDPPFTGMTGTILFVTQVPHDGFTTIAAAFGNHLGRISAVPRGGDLMLRYADGTLRNLTREAGFGQVGLQGDKGIAVRDPAVHWSGTKAIFSMVVGAPSAQYASKDWRWQLYEVSGLATGETAVVTRVPGQPETFNNISPSYAPDDTIVFVTDRPRDGAAHLYPQLDEYESAETNSGLWRLTPATGELTLLTHAPSGVFQPSVDSFGKVVFTKWDHLQRDQQADTDRRTPTYGAFTYSDETAGAQKIASTNGMESFPEPRDIGDPAYKPNIRFHTFNQFYPWEINVDGTAEETLNHVGRHELGGTYSEGSFVDDPNLTNATSAQYRKNSFFMRADSGMFHIREDAANPGRYYATFTREFGLATSGMIVRLDAPPDQNPEDMQLIAVTEPQGQTYAENPSEVPLSTGHFRNPLALSDGKLIASHTSTVVASKNNGTAKAPAWNYAFRLRVLEQKGTYFEAAAPLTAGIHAKVSWWSPDALVAWEGDLWELDAVEVRPRTRPTARTAVVEAPEMAVFAAENVDVAKLRTWLRTNDLALIISRNVTTRDRADRLQPFNLRVPGGAETVATTGKVYDVTHMQLYQADALRGYHTVNTPAPGRRLLARPMHGNSNLGPTPSGAPAGSVALGADGSMAAFVPARRALTWQVTSGDGTPVVRERNWVTFAAGEIRICASCHGLNKADQKGQTKPMNEPEALRQLMKTWKTANP